MNDATQIALIGVILGPSIATLLAAWIRRSERKADLARQDEVAARAEKAAKETVLQNSLIINKLDVVHSLVNSSLTQAMKDTSTAQKAQLLLMLEKAGPSPTKEMQEAISLLRALIGEGESALNERASAQASVDAAEAAEAAEA